MATVERLYAIYQMVLSIFSDLEYTPLFDVKYLRNGTK